MQKAFSGHGWDLSVLDTSVQADRPFGFLWSSPDGELRLASPVDEPEDFILDYLDLARAWGSRRLKSVAVMPLVPDLSRNSLEHFALDILLPRLIAGDVPLVLHGALLSRDGEAVCLVGDSGRGKSTLSATLRDAGWILHGDDALHLRAEGAGIVAQATYPSLRLFPDSLEHLFPDPPADLPLVADYLDKFRLDPGEASAPIGPCRLRAIFVLGEDDGSGEVTLRPLTASRLCMTLVGQGFALDPSDPKAAHRRLSAASAVAAMVPGFMLGYPRDYARLPEVIEKIGATLETGLIKVAGSAGQEE